MYMYSMTARVVGGTYALKKTLYLPLLSLSLLTTVVTTAAPVNNSNSSLQQQEKIIVKGKVLDENKNPLPGATVIEKGTRNHSLTNAAGEFSLKVEKKEVTLVFSYIGYQTRELRADADLTAVALSRSDKSLNEVVVTGFQQLDKRKFTGSVTQIDKQVFDRTGYIDVSRMLQGAAAGVSVQNVSGTFGTSPKIRIRGNASISANQEPLYVLNGIPISSPANVSVGQLYSGDPAALLGSAIAGLNAQDIEDISILKDGAATSLYGTRAANGVISITTKKGRAGNLAVNFTTAINIGLKPNINQFNLMNSREEMDLYKRLFDAGYYSNDNWPKVTGPFTEAFRRYGLRQSSLQEVYRDLDKATVANTNWFDVLFRNNIVQEHNLSFSGGNEKNTFYVSGSYVHDNGQAIGFKNVRYTTDFRQVLNLNKVLSIDINANYVGRSQNTPGTQNATTSYGDVSRSFEINPAGYATGTSRAMYPYNEDGSRKYYLSNLAPFNILTELEENFGVLKAQEFRVMVRPTVKITPALTYEMTASFRSTVSNSAQTATERSNLANAYRVDYTNSLRNANNLLYQNPNDPNAIKATILPIGGIKIVRSNAGKFYYLRNQLTFNKAWKKHSLNSLAGVEVRADKTDYNYDKVFGYLHYAGQRTSPSMLAYMKAVNDNDLLHQESFETERNLGFYTSHQYSYKSKYNFEAAGRLDGSNIFGRSVRTKFLPNYSFGFSWNVEQEEFFKKLNWQDKISSLKLRTSYALRGNTFRTSPMMNAVYENLIRYDAQNNDVGVRISAPELYNLNWERDYIVNFGMDFSLFNNNVTGSVEYYRRKNKDLITNFNTALEEGFSTKQINWASMENRGLDINIGIRNVLSSKDFRWGFNLVYGYVKNRIVDGELASINLTTITRPTGYGLNGYPLESLFAFRYAGLNQLGRPTFYNSKGVVSDVLPGDQDRSLVQYVGSRTPTSTGSVATNFGYKQLELRVFVTYALGHKVFKNPIAELTYKDNTSKSADLNYMWRTPGNETQTNIPGLLTTVQQSYIDTYFAINELAYNRSTERVVDASHFRLSEVMLSYNVGQRLLSRMRAIKSARMSLAANNIAFWGSKRLRGVDPDLYITGVNLPNPRTYSFRLSVGF
ncbi:SusC/RagA family TonB-linked outer membrane protein [Chitinophaga sp. MD30]|nr:SusC/RagA family TonB-linked outer membrane protein [Chitinophaga sp. MD30]